MRNDENYIRVRGVFFLSSFCLLLGVVLGDSFFFRAELPGSGFALVLAWIGWRFAKSVRVSLRELRSRNLDLERDLESQWEAHAREEAPAVVVASLPLGGGDKLREEGAIHLLAESELAAPAPSHATFVPPLT